jgi:hypothetical protein
MLLDPNPPVVLVVVVVADKAEPPHENPPAPILPLKSGLLAAASDELDIGHMVSYIFTYCGTRTKCLVEI